MPLASSKLGNERITIRVAEDGMSALASVVPGRPASAHDLDLVLDGSGVRFGVDQNAQLHLIERLADPEFSVRDLLLASGKAGVSRRELGFEPCFEVGVKPGRLREDGSMDFHDRGLLKTVVEGGILGRVEGARPGSRGIRVDGGSQAIATAGEALPQFGTGVELQLDGTVIAKRSGVVVYRAQSALDVVEQHLHQGDVDLRSGHLSTEGSLIICGDVKRMFGARAAGSLEIRGAVEGGSVYAGGDIVIQGGVRGGDAGIVSAGSNLRARHAERATLICGGLLTLDESVHCELTAVTIDVLGGLRGGTATGEISITAEQAGSPQGNTSTLLVAGVPVDRPVLPPQPVIVHTTHEVVSIPSRNSERPISMSSLAMRASRTPPRNSLASVRPSAAPGALSIAPLRLSERAGALADLSLLTEMADLAYDQAARAEAEQEAARHARAPQLLALASIQVFGTAHAGVTVQIGEFRLVLEQAMHGVCFSFDPLTCAIRTSPARR